MQLRLDGRVAIVSGAGRGLGGEFAVLLAQRGASVVVNDIGVSRDAARYGNDAAASSSKVAQLVADEIVAAGGRAIASTADISTADGAESAVDDAIREFGRVDILVNNAGILPYGSIEELSVDDLIATFAVHVGGAFNLSRASWPHLRAQSFGRIINIGSSVGIVYGNSNYSAYAAAKGGMLGLTRILAFEGAPHGIAANDLLGVSER